MRRRGIQERPDQTPLEAQLGISAATLLEQVAVPIYALDCEGRCTAINAAAERLFGYSQAECLGRNMHDLIHNRRPDGTPFPQHECALFSAGRGEQRLHLFEVLWTRDGRELEVECTSSPIIMEGMVCGTVVTLNDLTHQRQVERTLRAAEQQHREALRQRDAASSVERELAAEAHRTSRANTLALERAAASQILEQQILLATVAERVTVGIAVFDEKLGLCWHNTCFLDFVAPARRNQRLEGMAYRDIAGHIRSSEVEAEMHHVLDTGEPFVAKEFTTQLGNVTRDWRWSIVRLATGELMMVISDLTEQANARREVESLYQTAPMGLSVVSAGDLRIVKANARQSKMLGVPLASLVGSRFDEVFPMRGVAEMFRAASLGQTITNRTVEGELPSNPGERRYWSFNLVPLLREDGAVESISVAANEVTAQKRAEEALVSTENMAAMGRLAASISHEINNPLEAITNLLYLVEGDPSLSEESREYLANASRELMRVSQIASQTLRFHRHSTNPVSLFPRQLVDPVVALYQGRLHHARIQIRQQHLESVPFECNEGEVRQILNNLVGNAIDAMSKGGCITIRSRHVRHPKTGQTGTRILVSDSGAGISPHVLPNIFEPFFTTKGASGSGLGLWISRTLAQRQGGDLRVRSSQRQAYRGTTFSLFLPDHDAAQAQPSKPLAA